MILKYGEQKFYFSGDSGTSVFEDIYSKYDHNLFKNIAIFKHPHHGQNKVPKDFITVMSPKYVIVPNSSKHEADTAYRSVNSIVYALGGKLVENKTVITGAGDNLKGYVLAETDGYTLKITDRRK